MRFNFYTHLVIVLVFILSSFSTSSRKEDVEKKLIGVWVQEQGLEKKTIRYVKAKKFKENTRGIEFKEDGKAIIYETFGCQMPKPYYREWHAEWKVKNSTTLIIDRKYPGEKPDKLKIHKLSNHVLKVTWE